MPTHLARNNPANPPLAQRTVTANYNPAPDDDIIWVDASAASLTINVQNADPRDRPLYIKRIDNVQTNRVVVRDNQNGIDGSHGNDITLSVTSAFGVESGEGVTLLWDADETTWRVQ